MPSPKPLGKPSGLCRQVCTIPDLQENPRIVRRGMIYDTRGWARGDRKHGWVVYDERSGKVSCTVHTAGTRIYNLSVEGGASMRRAEKVSKRSRARPRKALLKRGRVKKTQLVKGVSSRGRKAIIRGRVAAHPSTPPVPVPSVSSSAIPLPASSLEQEPKTVTREPEPC